VQRVYIAKHAVDAEMLKDLLAREEIQAVVRGVALFGLRGGALMPSLSPSVWVHDEDFDRARPLVEKYRRGEPLEPRPAPTWRCPACAEVIEPQFTECWNCGQPRQRLR
jgi:hypothetical protein